MIGELYAFLCDDDLRVDELTKFISGLSEKEAKDYLMEVFVKHYEKVHVNRKLINAQYGACSEQLVLDLDGTTPDQIVKEMDLIEAKAEEEIAEARTHKRRRYRRNTKINIDQLPVENTDIYPDDPDYLEHPELYREVSPELFREIVAVPSKVYVKQQTRHQFVRMDENEETETFVCAKSPYAKLIENSFLSPSLAAQIIYDKVIRDLPLYRQELDFERHGFIVSRQTLSNWSISVTELYLEEIYNYMFKDLQSRQLVHIDETPLRVLQNAANNKMGNIIVARSVWNDPIQIALYRYTDRKDQQAFLQVLPEDYKGTIICDAAPAHKVFSKAILQYCMAHARREFVDAIKTRTDYRSFLKLSTVEEKEAYLASQKNEGLNLVLKALLYFQKLYLIEKLSQEANEDDAQRLERRQRQSVPVFELLKQTIQKINSGFHMQSPIAKAAKYFLNQEPGLRIFLSDGSVPIDNNPCERAVKTFVMARKNFLFSNTPNGAQATAICMSILQTAVLNRLRPEQYLEYVLDTLRKEGLKEDVIKDLLPYSGKLPENLYLPKTEEEQKKS